jgi:hypothetical protein
MKTWIHGHVLQANDTIPRPPASTIRFQKAAPDLAMPPERAPMPSFVRSDDYTA